MKYLFGIVCILIGFFTGLFLAKPLLELNMEYQLKEKIVSEIKDFDSLSDTVGNLNERLDALKGSD